MVLAAYVALLLAAAASDLWRLRIPNGLTLALVLLFALAALPRWREVAWFSHVAAAGLVFASGVLLFRLRLMGGGDVKLLAATAWWCGLELLPLHLALTGLLGLAVAGVVVASRCPTASPSPRRPLFSPRPSSRHSGAGENRVQALKQPGSLSE